MQSTKLALTIQTVIHLRGASFINT